MCFWNLLKMFEIHNSKIYTSYREVWNNTSYPFIRAIYNSSNHLVAANLALFALRSRVTWQMFSPSWWRWSAQILDRLAGSYTSENHEVLAGFWNQCFFWLNVVLFSIRKLWNILEKWNKWQKDAVFECFWYECFTVLPLVQTGTTLIQWIKKDAYFFVASGVAWASEVVVDETFVFCF